MIILANARQEDLVKMNEMLCEFFDGDLDDIRLSGGVQEAALDGRFPPWIWAEQGATCEQMFAKMKVWAEDPFPHVLDAFHELFLYNALEQWITEAEAAAEDAEGKHRELQRRIAEDLSEILDVAFDNTDFLHADEIASSVLNGTVYNALLGIDPSRFLGLLPSDIAERVRDALGQMESTVASDPNISRGLPNPAPECI